MMMTADRHDDPERRSDSPGYQSLAAVRSLHEHGVDLTGSESSSELSLMQAAVDDFRRAAETLAGRALPSTLDDDRGRHVIPPRAADETPRQYAERVSRMAARFRSLTQAPGRDRGAR
jgi:hypothetical protein